MSESGSWWQMPLKMVQDWTKEWSDKARKMVRMLRLSRIMILVLILLPIIGAGLSIWNPAYIPYTIMLVAVVMSIPLIFFYMMLGLPLKATSIVRLVDKGYPGNVKELAIRAAARKLHDQSIETEELLVDTAINESKKALRRYRERAERLREQMEKQESEAAKQAPIDTIPMAQEEPATPNTGTRPGSGHQ